MMIAARGMVPSPLDQPQQQQQRPLPRPRPRPRPRPDSAATRPFTSSNHPSDSSSLSHIRSRSIAQSQLQSQSQSQKPRRISTTFSGRSRSNTTNTSSSMSSCDALPFHSSSSSSSSSSNNNDGRRESVAKTLISRGSRILRRQGSKFSISATLNEEEDSVPVQRVRPKFDIPDFSSRSSSNSRRTHEQRKRAISGPFDFHHMTHTSPAQFQRLDRTREVDLVAEFAAIRASQRPVSGLKGIRADDIPRRAVTSGNLTEYKSERPSTADTLANSPTRQATRSRSESRIFENFSRPIPRTSRVNNPPPSTLVFPDMTEPAPPAIDEVLGLCAPQDNAGHVSSSSEDTAGITASMAQITLDGFIRSSSGGTDANATSNNFNLSGIHDPQEDESCAWRRSPEPPLRSPSSPAGLALSSVPQPASDSDDLNDRFPGLGSPAFPQYPLLFQDQDQEDRSTGKNDVKYTGEAPSLTTSTDMAIQENEDLFESWDADIDFCYENAAESSCNFDWFCTPTTTSAQKPDHSVVGVPVTLNTPDQSMSTQAQGLPLFTDTCISPQQHFGRSRAPSTNHIPPRQDNTSPMSNCNSEESLILSRAASIVRRHRSSISANSVPDLVHSSTTSSREGTRSDSPAGDACIPPTSSTVPEEEDRPASAARQHRTSGQVPESKDSKPQVESHDDDPKPAAAPARGRAKSVSEGVVRSASRTAITDKPLPSAPKPPPGRGRKKGRVSYSVFPSYTGGIGV